MNNVFSVELAEQYGKFKNCLDKYFGGEVAGLNKIKEMAQAGKIRKVVLAGMGSSYYALRAVDSYLNLKGIETVVLNGFEAARYKYKIVDENTLVIGVSQSGKSWELDAFFKELDKKLALVGICNKDESLLVSNSEIVLPMFADPETYFSNRSFLHSMAILNIIAYTIAGDDMDVLKAQLYEFANWLHDAYESRESYYAVAEKYLKNADIYDFIADGDSLASAYQGGITFREGPKAKTCSVMCADYAHDWILSVNKEYAVVMCVPEFKEEVEVRMYNRSIENGGKVLLITHSAEVKDDENTAVIRHPVCPDNVAALYQIVVLNLLLAGVLGEGWHR